MDLTFELADGSKLSLAAGKTIRELLAKIPDAKKALAVTVDGTTVDLHTPLSQGGKLGVVQPGTPAGLEVLRHTAAHVLAQAVARKLGRENVEFAIGPVIDDGFYYDFEVDKPFTPEFLEEVEAEMKKIVDEDLALSRFVADDKKDACARLDAAGKAKLKKELVSELSDDAPISFYSQGEFTDLCRGPHLPSTGRVGKAFKVLSVAAAYWRGNEKRESLQRIYATAFFKKEELDEYLKNREEAKRRDHRLLGKDLALFHIIPEAPGHPIWLPNGMVCRNAIEDMMREKLREKGYVEVKTPVVLDTSVWRTTGHMTHYRENMFFVHHDGDPKEVLDEPKIGMKPMNCPGSAFVFKQDIRSYRDLPLRLAEFGLCHRFEKAGVMSGLTRVRSFTQDDAHVYCAPEQLQEEIEALVAFVREVYSLFGFSDVKLFFATRPESRTGTDAMWDNAEAAIETSLKRLGAPYEMAPGDGAFYGPKIDFKVLDSLKREWQLATIQVDFGLAEKFDLYYADSQGGRTRPVVLHRAILGSLERMFAILIEHFGGAFPLWLAPEQVRIVPVATDRHEAACQIALAKLKAAGVRASLDMGSAKLGAKVREAAMKKVNYVLVIGDKEAESGQVNVRRRDGTNVGTMGVQSVINALKREVDSRSLTAVLEPSTLPTVDAAVPAASRPSVSGGVMRAVRLMGVGEAKLLKDVAIPEPGPGQVRIKVLAAGICGTDKHLCAGDATVIEKAKPPRTLGHEFCGEIDAFGPGAEGFGFAIADYVTAEMHVVCGRCVPCQTGDAHACERTVICGLHQDGSFADYVVVPATNVIKLDRAAVPLKVGAFLDALGNAMHCAQATSVAGRDIAIVGYGPIGAMAAAVVEFMGAAQVFVTEVHPFNLAHAKQWAATVNARHPRGLERVVVLDTGSNEKRKIAMKEVKERTNGKGVDAALEISGHPDAINDALEMTRWGGDLVELGIGKEKALTLHDWNGEVVFKGKNIKGIIGRRMYDTWFQMLGLLRAGLDVSHLVTHETTLDDFPDAMARFRRNETMKVVLYPTDRR